VCFRVAPPPAVSYFGFDELESFLDDISINLNDLFVLGDVRLLFIRRRIPRAILMQNEAFKEQ
jgi:hypothetical protein